MALLNNPAASKALATCDDEGNLNVVPKGTFAAIDEERIAYGDLFGARTNSNLEANGKAAVSVFTMDLPPVGYQIKGTFEGFVREGKLFDGFAAKVKELIKLDIRAVGVIRVDEVYAAGVPEPGKKLG
jgi:predicted pyridoxine 5'-phosphate oxidase superfamily flavin-nucleotide-binding protein